jgi:hypothetical protein
MFPIGRERKERPTRGPYLARLDRKAETRVSFARRLDSAFIASPNAACHHEFRALSSAWRRSAVALATGVRPSHTLCYMRATDSF